MTKLQILHTNDIHSRFERMPAIAALFKQLRAKHVGPSVRIDIGDHIDRSHLLAEGTKGIANVAIMNTTGYDYFVPGNNEGLALSHAIMNDLFGEQATFTTLGTNIFELATKQRPQWCKPYDILVIDGLKIAWFGLTASLTRYYRLLGWDVKHPIEMMQRAMEDVRGEVDAVIVMSHLGLEMDKKLAAEVPGITCIIGGHTHHLLETPERIGHTAICAAGKFGHYLGEVILTFEPNKPCSVEGRVHLTTDVEPDAEIEALIATFKTVAEQALTIPIATIATDIPHHYEEDSILGNLLAQVVRNKTNTPFAIINNGQFLMGFDAGEISKQMLLERCPSPVQICKMRLKGSLIRHTLEESLLEEFKQFRFNGFGFRGDVLGGLSVDGLSIYYDPDGPGMSKIQTILLNGKPLDDHAEYEFGTLDLFTFGVGYKKLQEGQDMEFFLPSIIRDELVEILNESSAIETAFHKRWHKL